MFTSALGSFDSGLGATQELGGPDSLVEQQFYAPLVLIDGEIWELPAADALSIPGQITHVFLMEDTTIYVDVNGDDEGEGTQFDPYATIFRAAEDYVNFVPGEYEIVVNLGEGVFTVDRTFDVAYSYGAKLTFAGRSESIATPAISNIDASATTGTAPYNGLEYIDFDLDLSAATSGPEVGQFVRMTGCTGGTNPEGLNGLHEIVAEAAGVATCRVWRDLSTTELPSGAITVASARLLKTVLHFTSDAHGIDIRGPFDMGNWDDIVIRGNDTAVTSLKRGVRLFNGAGIRAANVTGFATSGLHLYEWRTGFEVVGGAVAYCQLGSVAKMTDNGFQVSFGGTILAIGPFTANGVANVVFYANNGSRAITQSVIQSCGTAALAELGSFINMVTTTVHFDNGSGTAVFARDIGQIVATGISIVGFATDYNITTNTLSADGSFIHV